MLWFKPAKQSSDKAPGLILFLPNWSNGNPYQNLLKKAIEKQGVSVCYKDFSKGLFSLSRVINEEPFVTVLHVHWINNLIENIFWSKISIIQLIKLVLLALDVLYVRIRGVKVIWTIHNLVGHETNNRELEIKARKILAKMCSHIIIHSRSACNMVEKTYNVNISRKVSIIPHGNYDGCYVLDKNKALELKEQLHLEDDSIVLLFFGAVRPYKGVENLIETFVSIANSKLRLVIAGNPLDLLYSKAIIEKAKNDPRILFFLNFIPENHVAALFSVADIVALPFERTLTSGSVILGLTMGKALLLPEDARVFDLLNDKCCLFFDSNESMRKIISSLNKTNLKQMGKEGRLIADDLNWYQIGKKVYDIYIK